ncbi:MAG: AAA family ATPase [Myxococcales bacterium]|nr:AAA family ATPase [Polyangiaceae bacterium]MDW8249507.1 AAA family ATPase [Myxococcales bacterium]
MSHRVSTPRFPVALHLDPGLLPETPEPVEHRLALLPERSRRALLAGLAASAPVHLYVAVEPELAFERDLEALLDTLLAHSPGVDLLAAPSHADPSEPLILELPAGKGAALREALDASLRALSRRLSRLTQSEGLRAIERSLNLSLDTRSREAISSLEAQARDLGFGVRTINGVLRTFPILHGKPLSAEQLSALDEATRKELNQAEERLSEAVDAVAAQLNTLADETNRARDEAIQKAAEALLQEELTLLRNTFAETPAALEFLDVLGEELRSGWRDLLDPGHPLYLQDAPTRHRFGLHPLLLTSPDAPPPTELLLAPTPRELFGYIAARSVRGTLQADFTSIRPGALIRCARGVLVLRALDLLRQPELWTRLRRVLLTGKVEIEPPEGCNLQPRPIPVAPRIILLGTEEIHAEMSHGDPDFVALFPIKVEIEPIVDRSEASLHALDAYLTHLARRQGWLPLDRTARARLLDLSTRLAEDRQKISLALLPLEETANLASDAARRAERPLLSAADIDEAWNGRRQQRAGAALRALRQVTEGLVLIETHGRRVGVVNGLAVFSSADLSFGHPMRITAVVSPGTEGVVDVERESHLGGDIHTKGVAILRGLLSLLFGQERPLSLRAQITFEQSYGEIDGDSASSAEFFAILSALADVPFDQGLAVTGAISQLGEVQAIGGVCEKIEGFFDLCAARGLSGEQGVLIPAANLRHLVLRDDIARAIDEGKFHIYPISNVREGIEILSGIPAGERDAGGKFPAFSVFGRVERRLIELAERLRSSDPHSHNPLGADPDAGDSGEAPLRIRGM